MIIVGLILIVIAVVLFFVRQASQKKLFNIKATQTFKTQDVVELCNSIKEEIGPGSFNKVLEVKGVIKCENPLKAELSGQDCVYYSMSVTREYEERYTAYDEKNRPVQRTRRGSDTISSNTQSVHFSVEDDTGRITINPNGASIDSVQVVDRFDPAGANQTMLSFGSFSFNVPAMTGGTKTLGYRYRESVLPLNRKVFVLGEAADSSGELAVQKPKDSKESFLISLKSEEEIIGQTENVIKWTLIGMIAAASIGVALLIVGIIAG